jgi:hypothetical protein
MTLLVGQTVHGHSGGVGKRPSPEYRAWLDMKHRCFNDNNKSYESYGGRGITVCERWHRGEGHLTAFECFLADMGSRPSSQHSIDRYPDNDGNYEPGNCRWATRKQQTANRRLEKTRGARPLAKLTDEQVVLIRADGRSQRVIGKEYGICQAIVSEIKAGKRWSHVH